MSSVRISTEVKVTDYEAYFLNGIDIKRKREPAHTIRSQLPPHDYDANILIHSKTIEL